MISFRRLLLLVACLTGCCSAGDGNELYYECNNRTLVTLPTDIAGNKTHVLLGSCGVSDIPSGALDALVDLIILDLRDNAITDFTDITNVRLTKVTELSLSSNSINVLPDICSMFPYVGTIDLSGNRLTVLTAGAFSQCTATLSLNIGYNPITAIDSNALRNLNSLQVLTATKMPQLETVHRDALETVTSLHRISFQNSKMVNEYPCLLYRMAANQETIVDFRNNMIETVDAACFGGLGHALKTGNYPILYLSNNQIFSMTGISQLFQRAAQIHLRQNPLEHFKIVPSDPGSSSVTTFLDISSASQTLFPEITKTVIANALRTLTVSNNAISCIDRAHVAQFPNLQRLNADNMSLTAFPNDACATSGLDPVSSDVIMTSLVTLSLQSNLFLTVPDMHNFPELVTLDLTDNSITTVASRDLRFLKKLQELTLSGNAITYAQFDYSVLPNLEVISFNDNPLTTIPDVTSFMFNSEPVFHLEDVDLNCDQALCPMKDPFRKIANAYFGGKTQPCVSPDSLVSKPWEELTVYDLNCTLDLYRKYVLSSSGRRVLFTKMAVLYRSLPDLFLPETFTYAHILPDITEETCAITCYYDDRCSHFKHLPPDPNTAGECAVNLLPVSLNE